MLYSVRNETRPKGEDGSIAETAPLVTKGTYVDGRSRKWVGKRGNWRDEVHVWNALIISGTNRGLVGYFGLSELELFPGQDDSVRYGMIEGGNAVSVPTCSHCEQPAAFHVLQQSNLTKAHVITLRAGLLQKKNLGFKKSAMIGVLATDRGAVYAAHSGERDNDDFREVVLSLGWSFASIAALTGSILNRAGDIATDGSGSDKIQRFSYQCAAPKLVQAAIKDGENPRYMTEEFYNNPSLTGAQPSCSRCTQTVRYMLCPPKPVKTVRR